MLCLSDSIRHDDPAVQQLLSPIEEAQTLTQLPGFCAMKGALHRGGQRSKVHSCKGYIPSAQFLAVCSTVKHSIVS
jgi:hypothetical protein